MCIVMQAQTSYSTDSVCCDKHEQEMKRYQSRQSKKGTYHKKGQFYSTLKTFHCCTSPPPKTKHIHTQTH